MPKHRPSLAAQCGLLFLTLVALTVTGCGHVEVTTDFYRGEKWEAEIGYTVTLETLAMVGEQEITAMLDEMVAEAKAQGARASWSKKTARDSTTYLVTIKGEGLDTLSYVVFDGDAEIYYDEVDGKRAIYFSEYASGSGFETMTLTLRGGEIMYGNGTYVDNRTMSWTNHYGTMEAVLTERRRVNVLLIVVILLLLLGIGAILVGVIAFVLFKRAKATRQVPSVCAHCGFNIPPGAKFCPGCGQPKD